MTHRNFWKLYPKFLEKYKVTLGLLEILNQTLTNQIMQIDFSVIKIAHWSINYQNCTLTPYSWKSHICVLIFHSLSFHHLYFSCLWGKYKIKCKVKKLFILGKKLFSKTIKGNIFVNPFFFINDDFQFGNKELPKYISYFRQGQFSPIISKGNFRQGQFLSIISIGNFRLRQFSS